MIISDDLPTDSECPLSCVYWIHTKEQTDPKSSGYVGVSKFGWEKRFVQHKNDAANNSKHVVHRAMRKYGDAIKVTVLCLADPEFCLLFEEMLRPVPNMAGTWNLSRGGSSGRLGIVQTAEAKQHLSKMMSGDKCHWWGKTGSQHPVYGKKATEESRAIRREACKNNRITEEGKAARIAQIRSLQSWEQPAAQRNVATWLLAKEIYGLYTNEGLRYKTLAARLGLTGGNVSSITLKLKAGWNPNEDEAYLSWLTKYKQKELHESACTT